MNLTRQAKVRTFLDGDQIGHSDIAFGSFLGWFRMAETSTGAPRLFCKLFNFAWDYDFLKAYEACEFRMPKYSSLITDGHPPPPQCPGVVVCLLFNVHN